MSAWKIVDVKTGLIIILIAVLGGAWFFIGKDENKISLELEDKCGKFMDVFSHTIPDENSCKLRCKPQCEARDNRYEGVAFESSEQGCNHCTCYCK